MYSLAVVGGGPVGCRAAGLLQKQGFKAVVAEEHSSIGRPVSCSGLVSRSGIERLGLKLDTGVLVNGVRGAKIHSTTQTLVVEKPATVAYVINREAFDKQLAREAKNAGVNIMLNTKLLNIRGETVFVEREGRGELLKADFFLGTDGAMSKTRDIAGIKVPPENFIKSYQVKAKGTFDANHVEMFFGSYAPGFFAWIVPEDSSTARIGIGTSSHDAKEAFNNFVAARKLEFDTVSRQGGLIPVHKPLKNPVSGKVLLAGDAAFQTKSTTGGGLVSGLEAASVAASAVANHYKHGKSVTEYTKGLAPLYSELNAHWKIRSYLNSMGAEKTDRLLGKAKKAGIEEFLSSEGDMDRPSLFMKKVWFRPKLWGLLPQFLRI
jgi:geranylgeranyl reductase family protein